MRMKRVGVAAVFAMLVVVFIIGFRGSIMASEYEDETKKVNDKKDELVKKRDKLKKQIKNLEKNKKDVMQYIEKLDGQMQELEREEVNIEKDVQATDDDLKEVKKQLEDVKIKESTQYETMKKRIKYMYENGNSRYLDVILSSKSIAELLNRTEYVRRISQYDESLLKEFQETKKVVEDKEREVSEKLAYLNVLKEELKIQKDAISEMADNKGKEMKKYEKAIEGSEGEVKAYSEEIEKQEKILDDLILKEQARIQKEIEDQLKRIEEQNKNNKDNVNENETTPNPSMNPDGDNEGDSKGDGTTDVQYTESYTTGYRWPLNVSGTITSKFGPRNSPTAGASSYHQGIDIAVPKGTPIVASQTGTVVTAANQAAAGNYVMIHHGSGIFTVYMHCSSLAVGEGQRVKKGEVVAYVGSTGISTGPHLHFGVSVNGKYVDPESFVRR